MDGINAMDGTESGMDEGCRDVHGVAVIVGSHVRLLGIDARITECLPKREKRDIESLKGRVLVVDEVRAGVAYVMAEWDRGRGLTESHRFPLWPEQMEVVTG